MPPTTFGGTVLEARRRAGLTQRELARRMTDARAPVDVRTISAWERGPQEPRPGVLVTVLERILGLPPDALLIRLNSRTKDREAHDLRRHLRPERLYYVTTAISQHVKVDEHGRVTSIDTEHRIRALFSGVTTCVFAHADDTDERVRVEPVSGCVTNHWWPPIKGVRQVRIGLAGDPVRAGEERAFRYRVGHTYLGPDRPTRPAERRHRANGTPTLRVLAMKVTFARSGFTVRRCTWFDRRAEPLAGTGRALIGREGPEYVWREPRENTYGISWELPA